MFLYSQKTISEVFQNLKSSQHGLSEEEALLRQKEFGLNTFPATPRFQRLKIFFSQFRNLLVYILLAAMIISFLLGEEIDGYFILFVILAHLIIGFIQEHRANKTLEKLKEYIELKAVVIRGGKEKEIDAHLLVPGDIILLKTGMKVPADARVITCNDLQIDEAPLTGESLPVEKNNEVLKTKNTALSKQANLVFSGTLVSSGNAIAVVIHTGLRTEFGKVFQLVKSTQRDLTPLQLRLNRLSKIIAAVVIALILVVFSFGIVKNYDFFEIFILSVSLAVSAIPEGLSAAIFITLSVGMNRILKRKALVKNLLAVETLGSTNIICADKTGTLTTGKMVVSNVITPDKDFKLSLEEGMIPEFNHNFQEILKISLLTNNAFCHNPEAQQYQWEFSGSPTEIALLKFGLSLGFTKNKLEKKFKRIDEIPFSSSYKYMATLHRASQKENFLFLKGAPEIVLNFCSQVQIHEELIDFNSKIKENWNEKIENLSSQGFRLMAFASREIGSSSQKIKKENLNNFIFQGMVAIKDPLRKEARATLEEAQKSGLTSIMITGDHPLTALSIAKELGMNIKPINIIDGDRLNKMSEDELRSRIKDIRIYARMNPKDKIRIVDAWQQKGKVVAMTGDGINDAPALKSSDIGISLGSSTDIAKETSDIILMDDNFSTIVNVIKEGRVVFSNIKKNALYLLSDTFSEIILVFVSFLLGLPLPLIAAQILWINIIDDSFANIALSFEPAEKGIMRRPPFAKKAEIIDLRSKILIGLVSLITGFFTLGIYYLVLNLTHNLDHARTVAFASLALDTLFYVFSIRSIDSSIFKTNPFKNLFLIVAFFMGLGLQLMAIYLPLAQKFLHTVSLNLFDWSLVLGVSLIVLLMIEFFKFIFIHRAKNKA
jgi:Ca2+-transporting ATPase